MYTKTATAVVLALLGAANAGDIDLAGKTVTKENMVEELKVKDRGCAGVEEFAIAGGAKKTKRPENPPSVTDALTCFSEAAKVGVSYAA